MVSTEYKWAKKAPNITLDVKTLKYAYQPIYDIHTGSIYGYEALMRPEGCSPMDIIDAYTEANQLDVIEEISLYYGTKFFKEANLEGYLFINSFPNACMSLEAAKRVAEIGGDEMASRLVFEVLEYAETDESAWKIKKRAIEIYGSHPLYAIDDFGTGENTDQKCLDYYRPDIVKIDRQYIKNIDSDHWNQLILADIIKHLRQRGITVLAEGVETKEEYSYLLGADVDLMQGYYLGRPKVYA